MLGALAAHLKTTGTYSAVTLVRLTGINRTTEELRLPAETAASTGLACVSNAITIWQQAGYRPSLLLQAWNAILGSFEKSFPHKSFAVSIIPSNSLQCIPCDCPGWFRHHRHGWGPEPAAARGGQPATPGPPGGAVRLPDARRSGVLRGNRGGADAWNHGGIPDQ
jgi:hypothetical protein